jgi:hypothetical protein
VFFAKGDLAQAEKFVGASWKLAQHAEVGDHLAQIYEKRGRRADAIAQYGTALAADNPAQLVRDHLAALAGANVKPDALASEHRRDFDATRTLAVGVKDMTGKKADVAVLLSAPNIVEGVRFVDGDRDLATAAGSLKTLPIAGAFPDDGPARLLRRATLACSDGTSCTLTFVPPSDAKPVK